MNAISQFFQATSLAVKSKIALPFVKSVLNQLFEPYLYPIHNITESNSVVRLDSVKVKVEELNEMFLERFGLIRLEEASLSYITLDPIHTLIYHSSCKDACHITFHGIYAHLNLEMMDQHELRDGLTTEQNLNE